jgi:hypothetical protein
VKNQQSNWVAPRVVPITPPSRIELERWGDIAPAYAVATVAGSHWHPSVEPTLSELSRLGVHVERLVGCSDIVQARSTVATTLLDRDKSSAVLWLDSDTSLHPVDCLRLLDRCLLPQEPSLAPGILLTAISPSRGRATLLPVWDDDVKTVELGGAPSLIPIRAAGMGCASHPLALLADLAAEIPRVKQGFYPFFMPRVDAFSGWYLAEDFAFWDRAAALGWLGFADASMRVIHWGEYPYHWEDALEAWGPRQLHSALTLELDRTP